MRLGERLSHRLRCATAIGRVAGRRRKLFVVVIVVHDVCMILSVQCQGLSILRGRTFTIDVWMLPEAVLHRLEFLHAVDAFRILLREHKAREGLSKLHPTGSMGHSAKTWTIPVDLSGNRVERAAATLRLLLGLFKEVGGPCQRLLYGCLFGLSLPCPSGCVRSVRSLGSCSGMFRSCGR